MAKEVFNFKNLAIFAVAVMRSCKGVEWEHVRGYNL
jgi:hypothetical protein